MARLASHLAIRRAGLLLPLLASTACSSPASSGDDWELPFGRISTWEGMATGRLRGLEIEAPLVVTLSVGPLEPSPRTTEFSGGGTWEWAGVSGTAGGFWHPEEDQSARAAFGGTGCQGIHTVCSLTIELGGWLWCAEPVPDVGYRSFFLLGWMEGSSTMVASVDGTVWEGSITDGWPCPGPELVSFNTEVVLTRR